MLVPSKQQQQHALAVMIVGGRRNGGFFYPTHLLPIQVADGTRVTPPLPDRNIRHARPWRTRRWNVVDVVKRNTLPNTHEPQHCAMPDDVVVATSNSSKNLNKQEGFFVHI